MNSFETNFKKLTERGSLNTILQSVLVAMNLELEQLMTEHCINKKNGYFPIDLFTTFKEDLATACNYICDDILQHLKQFLLANHPSLI